MVDRQSHRTTALEQTNPPSHRPRSLLTVSRVVFVHVFVADIHFQYNGFLLGIFILSLAAINSGRDLLGAFLFAVLLNLKHIFLYVAPVYFVYLLFHYCWQESSDAYEGWEQFNRTAAARVRRFDWWRLTQLGLIVGGVCAVSFGPFVLAGQLWVVKDRLFPFKRGLSHAYWAPNVWALYNTADAALALVARRLRLIPSGGSSLPGGLVDHIRHQVLPAITPGVTFVLTALSMLPVLWRLSRWPHPSVFMPAAIYCSLCAFMLGWHVHEKAVLITLLPLALLACDRVSDSTLYLVLSIVGHYSLLPLLFPPVLTPLKLLLLLLYTLIAYTTLYEYHHEQQHKRRIRFGGLFRWRERVYLLGFVPLWLVAQVLCPLVLGGYEFLPLLLTSCYCSVGMCWGWWLCYQSCLHRIQMLESYEQE